MMSVIGSRLKEICYSSWFLAKDLVSHIPGTLVLKDLVLAYWLSKKVDYKKRISGLEVKDSGISEDGYPFIILSSNNFCFFGYKPTRSQRYWYRFFSSSQVKSKFGEDCIGVAYDIVLRYLGPEGPESRDEYIGHGKYYDFAKGDVVVEVGAYIGYYAMRVAELVGDNGRVIAIEAIGDNFKILKKNITSNKLKGVTLINKAAWKEKGELSFFRNSKQRASAIESILREINEETFIPCDTVDNILKDTGDLLVDFVRIQVNGAENEVLAGMVNTIKHYPIMLVAAIYDINNSPSWVNIQKVFTNKGYKTHVNNGNIFAWKE